MKLPKKNALVNTNPYLIDPDLREYLTVMSVHDSNRFEGNLTPLEKTIEHFREATKKVGKDEKDN
jgi:hypothetical protein